MDVNVNQKHTYIYMPCSFLRHFYSEVSNLGKIIVEVVGIVMLGIILNHWRHDGCACVHAIMHPLTCIWIPVCVSLCVCASTECRAFAP